jgi:hypothetical protein
MVPRFAGSPNVKAIPQAQQRQGITSGLRKKPNPYVILRVCDFFGFLAIFEHLTHLLSMALFGNIQKNHAL